MDLASVVAALASVGVRVSGSTPNSSVQVDSSRACPTGLAGPEPSGTINAPGQHFQGALWSLRGRGGCWGGRWWVISSSWRGGSILSTFWGPHSYTGGGRPTAHLWLSPVCGALRNVHPISDGTGAGPANSESRVAAIPSGTFSGSSLYRGHQSVLRGPDDPNLVYIG